MSTMSSGGRTLRILGGLLAAGPCACASTNQSCPGPSGCEPGVLLPAWRPLEAPGPGQRAARAAVYLAALAYVFLGMSIVADRFMAAIEVITSRERADGARVWNETVSNLTLMALGSSAPEILLSVIEVCGHHFEAGELGPATIVGSAAFNLFVIVAVCVLAVPAGQARRVRRPRVLLVTASWSLFAYVWLYVILAVRTPAEVEVWEALLTLAFFPCLVLLAWAADRRLLLWHAPGPPPPQEGREEAARELHDLRREQPRRAPAQLLELARRRALARRPKSRAFYRIQATRRLTGEGDVLRRRRSGPEEAEEAGGGERVSFQRACYECVEGCGAVRLAVLREGGRADGPLDVDYRTEDGTARAGSDYEPAEGTLRFGPGERRLELTVQVLDDEVGEPDEFFRVRLAEPRSPGARLGPHGLVTVTILDDDQAGCFSFEQPAQRVSESAGVLGARVVRSSGARGAVLLPYGTAEGTARAGRDFVGRTGTLLFGDGETQKIIEVQIIEDEDYEKNKNFFIELGEPQLAQGVHPMGDMKKDLEMNVDPITSLGCPLLGDHRKMEVIIEESYEFKSMVDKLIKKTNLSLVVSTSSWREQFVNAVTVSAGADDDEEGFSEEPRPSCFDYIMHFLTVFWKVLFALVPPTEYLNGWACFVVSIMLIGLLTAITGDLAKQFGCTVGLKNSVTAIVFVALGTSVPDTFASKVAAVQDEYADASIGNVTGSNAVNVFLGIGVAWTIAAIYWATKGERFLVDPGNLAFSVTIFTIFAFISVAILLYRRRAPVGGELGGPRLSKLITSGFFILLWLLYIILSSLEAYCYITGF
ncbi:sodium/calcium exchanger 2-like isoform X2 [Narcine bancroftii]|uniref:sodium/calcium exchanger 2-like isoform X2 n=1 Tax=Narcine bancroftii TaxID=1343680 RepID=UPI003831F201